jgi:hypothetical protein
VASSSFTQQLDPLWKTGVALGNGQLIRDVHYKAARKIQKDGLQNIERAIGKDRMLRNFPRPGRKVRLYPRYKVKGKTLTVSFVPSGLASLVENGNKYGGGPKGKKPVQRTAKNAPAIWQDELALVYARRLRL